MVSSFSGTSIDSCAAFKTSLNQYREAARQLINPDESEFYLSSKTPKDDSLQSPPKRYLRLAMDVSLHKEIFKMIPERVDQTLQSPKYCILFSARGRSTLINILNFLSIHIMSSSKSPVFKIRTWVISNLELLEMWSLEAWWVRLHESFIFIPKGLRQSQTLSYICQIILKRLWQHLFLCSYFSLLVV